MQDLIDRRDLGERGGFDLVAYKVADLHTHVEDFDCYEKEDKTAWRNDEWHFVGVIVQASMHGVELGEDAIFGVEDGFMPVAVSEDNPDGLVDAFDHTLGGDDGAYDLPDEAIEAAKAMLVRIEDGRAPAGYVQVPHELAIMAVRAFDDAAYRFEREADEAGDEETELDRRLRQGEYKNAQARLERVLWGQEGGE